MLKIKKYSQQPRQLRPSGLFSKSNNICTSLEGITKSWGQIPPNSLNFTIESPKPDFFPVHSIQGFKHHDALAPPQISQGGFSREKVWASGCFKVLWVILVQSSLKKASPFLLYGTALTTVSVITQICEYLTNKAVTGKWFSQLYKT